MMLHAARAQGCPKAVSGRALQPTLSTRRGHPLKITAVRHNHPFVMATGGWAGRVPFPPKGPEGPLCPQGARRVPFPLRGPKGPFPPKGPEGPLGSLGPAALRAAGQNKHDATNVSCRQGTVAFLSFLFQVRCVRSTVALFHEIIAKPQGEAVVHEIMRETAAKQQKNKKTQKGRFSSVFCSKSCSSQSNFCYRTRTRIDFRFLCIFQLFCSKSEPKSSPRECEFWERGRRKRYGYAGILRIDTN